MAHGRIAALSVGLLVGANLLWYAHFPRANRLLPLATMLLIGGTFVAAWAYAHRGASGLPSRRSAIVLGSGAALLAVFWMFGRRSGLSTLFGVQATAGPHGALLPFYYVAATSLLLRMAVPWLVSRYALRIDARDVGYRAGGGERRWHLYALLAVGGALLAVAAATQPAFLRAYPRCAKAIVDGQLELSVFLVYQLAYLTLFVSGESFWRGYLLFGLEPQYGRAAIYLSTIPYAVLHYGKPQLEALGAIAAGILLGHLALWHRSFWAGVAIHYSVALSMDLAALWHRGVRLTL